MSELCLVLEFLLCMAYDRMRDFKIFLLRGGFKVHSFYQHISTTF